MPRLLQAEPGVLTGSAQFSTPLSVRVDLPAVILQASYASSPSTADWNGRTSSSELEDVESGDDLGTSSLAENIPSSGCQNVSVCMHNAAGHLSSSRIPLERRFDGAPSIQFSGTSVWPELHTLNGNIGSFQENFTFYNQQNGTEEIARKLTESKLDVCNLLKDGINGENLVFPDRHLLTSVFQGLVQEQWKDENGARVDYCTSDKYLPNRENDTFQFPKEPSLHFVHQPFQENAESHMPTVNGNITLDGYPHYNESGELKKLDSFGRWMNTEIGGECGVLSCSCYCIQLYGCFQAFSLGKSMRINVLHII